MRRLVQGAIVLATVAVTTLALADARKLTVEEAVAMALDTNPALAQARAHVEGQKAMHDSARGRLLPSFHVAEEYQHWDSPYNYIIAAGSPPFKIRDQNTNSFSVSGDQPLIGLGHLASESDAQKYAAESGVMGLSASRADLRAAVETYFIQLFEARALEDIAKASEEELAEQVTIAEARLKAGVFTNADVLRVRVSQANAKQQEIQAHAEGEVARANLLGRIGLPLDDRSIDFAPPTTLLAKAKEALPDRTSAAREAIQQRPEIQQTKLAAESAHQTEKSKAWSLLPDADLEAGYFRTDGSLFNPPNAAFVGVKAQWAIWEWGATYYAKKAAAAEADAARFAVADQERRIGVEVASDLAQATSAVAALDVAKETIASAEEAYRVTKVSLQAGTATTTDLLNAQAALTEARLNLTRAEYEDAIARVTLRRGLGSK
jgi:outer membrane protein